MGDMRRISLESRREIKRSALAGFSSRKIANQLNIGYRTVCRYMASYGIKSGKSGTGRGSKMSNRLKAILIRKIGTGELANAGDAARYVKSAHNIEVSGQAIRNILRRTGLKSRVKVKKPRLTSVHVKKRLIFSRFHRDHGIDYWKNVMFTDESKINLYGPDGNKRVWRRPGCRLLDHHIRETVKFGGGGVMVWGAISCNGVGKLVFVEGIMDSAQYQSILRIGYAASIKMNHIDRSKLIFQQDNDPKHRSKSTKKWMKMNKFNVLEWPSNSPDMNPIENLWNDVKRRIKRGYPQARNINELKFQIEQEWYKTSSKYVEGLFNSIPRRIKALLDARGGHTKY